MTAPKLRLCNLDRQNCIAHVALNTEHDFCHVYDDAQQEKNPLTGHTQSKLVKFGTLTECLEFMRSAQ